MTDRRAFRVTGRVQGVGFRWWTRQTATALELRGTVRNARDGSVELEVEGTADALDAFEERLRNGPTHARVQGVVEEPAGSDALPAGFDIVR